MQKRKVTGEEFIKLAEIYNREGRTAVKKVLGEQYGVKDTNRMIRCMKEDPSLGYDRETEIFTLKEQKPSEPEGVFMSMEELCVRPVPVRSDRKRPQDTGQSEAMEKLIHDLIGEKLLELSRYVTISPISRIVIIDKSSLEADGYRLTVY